MFENFSFSVNLLCLALVVWLFYVFLNKGKNEFIITKKDNDILLEALKTSKDKDEFSEKIYKLIMCSELFNYFEV